MRIRNKIFDFAGLIFILTIFVSDALSEEHGDFYMLLEIGGSYSKNIGEDFKGDIKGDIGDSVAFSAGLGFRINNKIHSDIICSFRPGFEASIDPSGADIRGDVRVFTSMVNIYWDIWQFRGFRPYIGTGIGVSFNKAGTAHSEADPFSELDIVYDGESVTDFAYQMVIGSTMDITSDISMNIRYCYIDAGEVRYPLEGRLLGEPFQFFEYRAEGDIKLNELYFGFNYYF